MIDKQKAIGMAERQLEEESRLCDPLITGVVNGILAELKEFDYAFAAPQSPSLNKLVACCDLLLNTLLNEEEDRALRHAVYDLRDSLLNKGQAVELLAAEFDNMLEGWGYMPARKAA